MSRIEVHRAAAAVLCAILALQPVSARQDPAPAPPGIAPAQEVEGEEEAEDAIDPSEYQEEVELRARLSTIEMLPTSNSVALARYRVVGGAYDGTVFILSFSPTRPLRLRHWGLHRASATRQIGGGIVSEPTEGQWDPLLPWGSTDPVEWITMTLLLTDLDHGEKETPRPYFKALLGVGPLYPENR